MYQILKNNTIICNAHDMATAIHFVKSLESTLDRGVEHSPYTIRRVESTVA